MFALSASLEEFDLCRKDDLLQSADLFSIQEPCSATKGGIKRILYKELAKQQILPEGDECVFTGIASDNEVMKPLLSAEVEAKSKVLYLDAYILMNLSPLRRTKCSLCT